MTQRKVPHFNCIGQFETIPPIRILPKHYPGTGYSITNETPIAVAGFAALIGLAGRTIMLVVVVIGPAASLSAAGIDRAAHVAVIGWTAVDTGPMPFQGQTDEVYD